VRARGFSLLEALVTLVIVAAVMALLMQSLVHVLGMRERVLRHELEARVEVLHERWFRETIAAALADRPGAEPAFSGSETGLALLSADAAAGGMARIGWRVIAGENGLQLEYAQAEQRWPLASDGIDAAAFDYLDRDGQWHPAWPLAERPDDILPRAVRLTQRLSGDRGERVWWAEIGAAPGLPPALRNQMDFADATF